MIATGLKMFVLIFGLLIYVQAWQQISERAQKAVRTGSHRGLACARSHSRFVVSMDIYGKFSRPVQIDLGMLGWAQGEAYVNGELSVSFSPWLKKSSLETYKLELPLGIDIEQSDEDGICRIVGISGTGSANSAENIKVGDMVRAITAREQHMVYPQAQVALGGIGRPQLVTTFLPVERRPDAFDKLMDGIRSNLEISSNSDDAGLREQGRVQLVLERPL